MAYQLNYQSILISKPCLISGGKPGRNEEEVNVDDQKRRGKLRRHRKSSLASHRNDTPTKAGCIWRQTDKLGRVLKVALRTFLLSRPSSQTTWLK
eukprot:875229-Pelagomonas_calceolata.AAC.1